MDSTCQGRVLLVGDGDFSFTVSLLKNSTLQPSQVTSSNIETPATIQQHKLASDNMKAIQDSGGSVLLEVDARELHTHPVISQYSYERIIFNFPLADRHNIKKNRALLSDFFASCASILSDEGQVMVTLCKGQGGTPADKPMRSWHDSWQVVAMSTASGFALTNVLLFDADKYPEYHSVGFRFQDKSFSTAGSITHVFERIAMVEVGDASARSSLQLDSAAYSCSSYIVNKRKRNLLHEARNPVCLVSQALKHAVSQKMELEVKAVGDESLVVKGHRSRAVMKLCQSSCEGSIGEGHSTHGSSSEMDGERCKSETASVKEMKDEFNENLQNQKASSASKGLGNQEKSNPTTLAHGVSQEKMTHLENIEGSHEKSGTSLSQRGWVLPSDPEAVYSAIECSPRTPKQGDKKESSSSHNGDTDVLMAEAGDDGASRDDPSQRVFHLRTSLLEVVGDLCSESVTVTKTGGELGEAMDVSDAGGGSCCEATSMERCFAFFGQCYQPYDVCPESLPVRHEMLMVHKRSGLERNSAHAGRGVQILSERGDAAHPGPGLSPKQEMLSESLIEGNYGCDSNSKFAQIITDLNGSGFCANWKLELIPENHHAYNVCIEGVEDIINVKIIQMFQPRGDNCSGSDTKMHPVGLCLSGILNGDHCEICVLNLDDMACMVCSLPDPRLLWSASEKFTQQFQLTGFPQVYRPICLYPMRFVHDLSFWLKDSDETVDECELWDAVRCTAGDLVVRAGLIDTYQDPTTGQCSRCYRLLFISHDQALPYLTSWKLQSSIRVEVARRMGVTLR